MKPLRLGIVGPGLIWENSHRSVLDRMSDHFAISAFSASSERSRQKVARDYPEALFFRDYHELAASPAVDAVVVLTPIALNAPVAMAALRAGKDVFMEKPMARSAEEARELARVAREAGRRVFVLEQSAYRPWGPVLDVLHSGEIGDLVMFDRTAHDLFDATDHPVRGYGTTDWRIHPEFPLGTLSTAATITSASLPACSAAARGIRLLLLGAPEYASVTTC
jgi:predicted dehydrogenase